MHVSALAGSESDAAELRDVFRAGTSMGRLSVQDSQPDVLKLYDGLNAVTDGRSVRIDIREPFELLDSVLASLWPAGGSPRR
jgi:hypothetical protein